MIILLDLKFKRKKKNCKGFRGYFSWEWLNNLPRYKSQIGQDLDKASIKIKYKETYILTLYIRKESEIFNLSTNISEMAILTGDKFEISEHTPRQKWSQFSVVEILVVPLKINFSVICRNGLCVILMRVRAPGKLLTRL